MPLRLAYQYDSAPLSLTVSGNISEVDYAWKIEPLVKSLEERDLDSIFLNLFSLKSWARRRAAKVRLKATLLFRLAFLLFCRKHRLSQA